MVFSTIESLSYRKLALIISNGAYKRPENQISDADETAKALAEKLTQIGFQVTQNCDMEKHDMTTTIIDFSKSISSGDLVLFYYFGHCYQLKGKNYLIPVGDGQIEMSGDVEDFAIDFERVSQRLVERDSLANVWILDCSGTYSLQSSKASSSKGQGKGLAEMQPKNGVFVQFACGANEAVGENSFTQHFLNSVTEENVNTTDLFRQIAEKVSQKSNQKQRPLSMNGISRSKEVYLNEIIYRQVWVDLKSDDIAATEKKQEELRACYDNYPSIDEVMNRETPDMKKAEALTQSILSKQPSGQVDDTNTMLHAMKTLVAGNGRDCLFFDSREGVKLHDASTSLTDLNDDDKPFVLKLHSNEEFLQYKDRKDPNYDLKVVKTLDDAIQNNESHPVLEDIANRLSKAHNTDRDNIDIKIVYVGSFNVVYTIKHLAGATVRRMTDMSQKLKEQFTEFAAALLHPLLFRPSFDIAQFDAEGNKSFPTPETHQVGPRGREKPYTTPVGYTRYGLKVLDRYGSNDWLEPFGDPDNWYRAYHGTGRASGKDFGLSDNSADAQYASVDAAASIHKTGFRKARVHAFGEGVYCSPNPTFVEKAYAGEVKLDTTEGEKQFKMMLQVAVNPDDVKFANEDIWLVSQPESIRSYGILIKET